VAAGDVVVQQSVAAQPDKHQEPGVFVPRRRCFHVTPRDVVVDKFATEGFEGLTVGLSAISGRPTPPWVSCDGVGFRSEEVCRRLDEHQQPV
jgi:hypothetical protein